jgi:hypothetical protein
MLKIKEFHKDGTKIELKELEKFEFINYFSDIEPVPNCLNRSLSINCFIAIFTDLRIIKKYQSQVRNNYFTRFDREKRIRNKDIQDLIQADLVEKVEE